MAGDERELAEDCWKALSILHGDVETPEWLAAAASHLASHQLPS